jgi:hypothetical protein
MSVMAHLIIDADSITVALSTAEKLEALHGDVTLPRSAVVSARSVPDGMTEIRGLRAPGTGVPGVLMAGTWRGSGAVTFAVCHGRGPAVVLDLVGASYDRIVLTVDDPEQVLTSLR